MDSTSTVRPMATQAIFRPNFDDDDDGESGGTATTEPMSCTTPRWRGCSHRPAGSVAAAGEIPRGTEIDPLAALMVNPVVAEAKRFCWNCGRQSAGPRRRGPESEGCPHCGSAYSFVPQLSPGDMVADQYEIRAACARWSGLGVPGGRPQCQRTAGGAKGVWCTWGRRGLAIAMAERQFLAEVAHPAIVKIFNFVEHPDSR